MVTLTGLREEGVYTLFIVATDLVGNVARTTRKFWTVGEQLFGYRNKFVWFFKKAAHLNL